MVSMQGGGMTNYSNYSLLTILHSLLTLSFSLLPLTPHYSALTILTSLSICFLKHRNFAPASFSTFSMPIISMWNLVIATIKLLCFNSARTDTAIWKHWFNTALFLRNPQLEGIRELRFLHRRWSNFFGIEELLCQFISNHSTKNTVTFETS
jgi:hypothetical protein